MLHNLASCSILSIAMLYARNRATCTAGGSR
jgi:hypothetical protein